MTNWFDIGPEYIKEMYEITIFPCTNISMMGRFGKFISIVSTSDSCS